MVLIKLNYDFSVCKVDDIKSVDFTDKFVFLSKTDDEISLVCKTEAIPSNITEVEHGWKALKISGILDFSMLGVIAKISNLLFLASISIFVVSTFNTDYIFLKSDKFNKACEVLGSNGYVIK